MGRVGGPGGSPGSLEPSFLKRISAHVVITRNTAARLRESIVDASKVDNAS